MRSMRKRLARLGAALALAAGGLASEALSQQDNPVYINDSPQAWQQFRRAHDQIKDNVGEAVREFQELLDDYATRLVPMHDSATNQFTSVRERVLAELRGHERLLERYQLIEAAEAQRLLEAGELERLVLTRSLTEPGLEGLLRLAQADLEAGWLDRATTRAAEAATHPKLNADAAAYCWYVQALAGHYRGDAVRAADAAAQLDLLEGPRRDALRAALERLLAVPAVAAPNTAPGRSPLDRGDAAQLDDVVGEPIWSKPLDQSLIRRIMADPSDIELEARDGGFDASRREGRFLTVIPTVADAIIFINEGHRVRAYNRLTERMLWSALDGTVTTPLDREAQELADMNVVAAGEGAVVTLTGHALREGRSGGGAIVCLDALTGLQRWSVRLDRLGRDEEFSGLFPYGSPIIADGAVFVLARKVSAQQLASTYLIALDLDDGALTWSLHIDSSGGLQTRITRPYSTLVYEGGDLFISTALGAVACVDAASGVTRWLHRFAVPISPLSTDLRPWEISGPVVTSRGVIAIQPDGRRVVLLDRTSGERLESHPIIGNSGWGEPRYLLADDHSVFAIARNSIRGFSLGNLADPIWSLQHSERGEAQGRRATSRPDDDRPAGAATHGGGSGGPERLAIRGRVQLLDGALIAPTAEGLLIIDSESGGIVHRLPQVPIGNLIAVDGQIVMAGEDRLDAYMPLQLAQRMLRERLAGDTSDPEPALALLRLGMRAHDLKLALEGAELAWRILAVAPAGEDRARTHDELFALLLQMNEAGLGADQHEAESIFAVMSSVATQPSQRVRYLLVYGDWLAPRSLPEAIEAYQTILSDRALAATPLTLDDLRRPGGNWACDRLGQLVRDRGPGVYAREADFAASALTKLTGGGDASPEALLALAGEFPLSGAAVAASLQAAEQLQSRRQPLKALAALTRMQRLHGDGPESTRIVAAIVKLCLAQGWHDQAAEILRLATDRRSDPRLMIDGVEKPASAWLQTLRPDAPSAARPLMGDTLATAEEHQRGQLIPMYPGVEEPRRNDAVLLLDGTTLRLLSASGLQQLWSVDLGESSAAALRFTREELVLWLGGSSSDPRVVSLNPADGSQRWITPRLSEHLPVPPGAGDKPPVVIAGQTVAATETIPMLGDERLVLVRRAGGIVAFDPADPSRVIWRRERTLEQVHFAGMNDTAVVLIGLRVPPAAQPGLDGAILVLDPATGETRHELTTPDRSGVRWSVITPTAELAYATDEGIEMVDLLSGEWIWSSTGVAAASTRDGWPAGDRIIIEDGAAEIRSCRCHDGWISEPFDAPIRGEWLPRDLREVVMDDGQILARYADRIIRFGHDDRRLGADVVSDERDYRWLLLGRGVDGATRMLVISQERPQQMPDNERGGRFTSYSYKIYMMAADGRLLGREINQVQGLPGPLAEVVALDQVLALSVIGGAGGPGHTYWVRMPAP